MSKIIEEVPTCSPKIPSDKRRILSKIQLKNAFVTSVRFFLIKKETYFLKVKQKFLLKHFLIQFLLFFKIYT